jgi:hypothetical protein
MAPVGRMSGDRALVFALAVAASLTGCTQGEEAGGAPATGTETALSSTTLDPGDCDGGETGPLTVEELLEGMRAAGYDMYVDPGCASGDSAEWVLSNTSVEVEELEPQDFGRAQAREGAISCQVYDPTVVQGATVRVVHFDGEDWTTLQLLNVSCNITPDPAKERQQIDRLQRTLNQLAAKSG